MTQVVLDASVVMQWHVPEEHSAAAREWLSEDWERWAPDLLFSELGNILWKKHRRGEINRTEARRIAAEALILPVRIQSSETLLATAFDIATEYDRTVYDSLYVALALFLNCQLVTADDRLVNSLRSTRVADSVRHVREGLPS